MSCTSTESSSNDSSSVSSPARSKDLDLDSYFSDLPDEKSYKTSISAYQKNNRKKPIYVRSVKTNNEEDDDYITQRWNQMLERQRQTEAEVRKVILNRDRLHPFELSKWLDSEDTCNLPIPSLGVQLRMVKQNSSSQSTVSSEN
ncbi:hypothetical protein BY996DRAFT_6408637 [Phakopsora pachyrhizi]|uniref:Uncharacterized protein n=1 Tax=Phakopsora pachyrhizi TaxID=170000 RepID=A0AAV0BMD3_PHAPC|nr:hypothetical protein BY996DRAFT_6408637 [Phakopsora pachyrhizi]CAH7688214.1 hypothetical protein PPACK8108_LOCUS23150 [Phakopsora pachyrhizi]